MRCIGCAVVGVIVDHDRHDVVSGDLLGHRLDDRADVLGLVEGRADRDHRGARRHAALGIGPVEALHRECLDELADGSSAPVGVSLQTEQHEEQHHDGAEQHADEPAIVARLEVERAEDRIEQARRGGEQHHGDRGQERCEHAEAADVATLIGPRRGDEERDPGDAGDQPEGPHGVSAPLRRRPSGREEGCGRR